jgi:gamma-glutamyltranspeptidase/glutathione hydrolase
MYLDTTGKIIDNLSKLGILAAGIPGTIAGLIETHNRFGRLQPWSTLVEPAIALAEKGFRITTLEADRLNKYRADFKLFNPPDMPFLANEVWKEGDLLIQKELAATLRLIAEHGHNGFYAGPNAEVLVALSQKRNGFITFEDLAQYEAIWREPQTISWRGFEIHSMGLPSSGGIVLGQILGMIEHRLSDSVEYRDAYHVHLITEAARRAFADRAIHLGDKDFHPVEVDRLLNKEYLTKKMEDFDPFLASQSHSMYADKFILAPERFETTHLSIADADGNAASVTTTLNDNYGCKVWVPGGGYFLNNQMDDFSSKPGVPNLYGLVGGEANAIAPGKRMLSSMTPTILEKDGQLYMLLGSPGGPAIITSVLQVLLQVTSFGLDIDKAVQAPRFHHQWLPDEILHEPGAFSDDLIQKLNSMGHQLKSVEYIGMIDAIYIDQNGRLHGAADRRGDDHAAGW